MARGGRCIGSRARDRRWRRRSNRLPAVRSTDADGGDAGDAADPAWWADRPARRHREEVGHGAELGLPVHQGLVAQRRQLRHRGDAARRSAEGLWLMEARRRWGDRTVGGDEHPGLADQHRRHSGAGATSRWRSRRCGSPQFPPSASSPRRRRTASSRRLAMLARISCRAADAERGLTARPARSRRDTSPHSARRMPRRGSAIVRAGTPAGRQSTPERKRGPPQPVCVR